MEGTRFRLCDVIKPLSICSSRITSFMLFILILFSLLQIHLAKIHDFDKECSVCYVNGDFIGFSNLTGSKLNIQNGSLHWLNRGQNFDIQIATSFLLIIRF